jgi:hypothetical protein
LIRLYQRLAGEIEKAEDGEAPLLSEEDAAAEMHHVTALLAILGVNFDSRRLKARKTRIQIGPLDYGGMRRGMLKALRTTGTWMSYSEIVDALVVRYDLVLTVEQRRHFQQKIREAASILRQAGLIEPELRLAPGCGPQQQRWRLVTGDGRRLSSPENPAV